MRIPVVTQAKSLPVSTLLDRQALVFLNNYNLPKHLTTEWRLLFSNVVNGDSFTQLVGHIINKGPSLIVVKDKEGYIYGGFASQGWELRPKFYGKKFVVKLKFICSFLCIVMFSHIIFFIDT